MGLALYANYFIIIKDKLVCSVTGKLIFVFPKKRSAERGRTDTAGSAHNPPDAGRSARRSKCRLQEPAEPIQTAYNVGR